MKYSPQSKSAFGLAILFFLMFLAIPYMHNHQDIALNPDDCPAYLLQITIVTFIIGFLFLSTIFRLPDQSLIVADEKGKRSFSDFHPLINKAPPSL